MTQHLVQQLPSPWLHYAIALQTARKPVRPVAAHSTWQTAPLPPDAQRLSRYLALCGLAARPTLPPLWPQILAGPLHLAMVTGADWPAPALGMVHLRNTIEQFQPIAVDAELEVLVYPGQLVDGPAGLEVAIDTEVRVNGALLWRSQLVALHKVKGKRGKPTPASPFAPPERSPDRTVEFAAPEDIGRAYGRVAGDINPIHIHALAAKAFGFPRAIAHGTWTAARALAAVSDLLPEAGARSVHHTIRFVRPVYLPATLTLVAWQQGSHVWWQVHSGRDGQTVHVRGEAFSG